MVERGAGGPGDAGEWHFAGALEDVALARNRAAAFVEERSPDAGAMVRLLVGELAANAVLHARTPFTVRVAVDGGRLALEVTDSSDVPPVMRPPDPTAPNGRGLQIVHALSERWGTRGRTPGKAIWAELALAG